MVDAFGTTVRAIDHPDTRAAGIAGLAGIVHGWTTPSHGYLTDPIVGQPVDDVAVAIDFGAQVGVVWVVPGLIETIDVGAGSTARIGDQEFIKQVDGTWSPK